MSTRWKHCILPAIVASLLIVSLIVLARSQAVRAEREAAAKRQANPEAEQAIQTNAEAFIEAFHKGDASALASFWTMDGDYTNQHGRHLQGRAAIEKAFQAFFEENKGLKLRINSVSLRFVTPEVAVEDGTTEVKGADGEPPSEARYTIVHVKKDGKWYLSSVRDSMLIPRTNYEQLRQMEWLIGEWSDEVEGAEVGHMAFTWSDNQGFIVNTYSISAKTLLLSSGTQWIGWDPSAKRFRSWTFDSMGGFGEGSWTKEGNKWVIKSNAVLQDGRKMTTTNIVRRIDADTISWQGTDRTLDGKPIPDMKEVKMKRLK
ncbi:MAG TPA: SgcJ/EcaC family oxidoreductase [Gemmataceae bacterium]|nr:SgcJ/EcaC family oxidoreductase [Gemmataceae bacterium]